MRLDRVVVAVPDGDLSGGEPLGHVARRDAVDPEREGRNPSVHRLEPVQHAALGQSVEEALAERPLVRLDRIPAELVQVLDCCDEPCEQLVCERSRLEARSDRLVGRRPHLVGPPRPQELLPAERKAEMRPEELVRRAEENVDAEGRDVDRPVRCVVHRVGPGKGTRLVREPDDPPRIRDRPDGVRGEREGDDTGALGQLLLEVVEVEGRVGVDFHEAHLKIEVVRELQPRRDVAVVVEACDEDLVAGRERPSERAREREVERRHVLAEDRLRGRTAEEASRGGVRQLDELVAAAAGGERSAEVRVGLAEIPGDRVDHGTRALSSAGSVEEGDAGAESGELCADRFQIDGGGRHLALFEGRHGQPVLAQLFPVQLGLLVEAGPHDGLPGAVDLIRQPHPVVVRDAGDDGRQRGRDTLKGVVVVVEDDHEPGSAEARSLAAVEPLPRRSQRAVHESIVRPFTTHR